MIVSRKVDLEPKKFSDNVIQKERGSQALSLHLIAILQQQIMESREIQIFIGHFANLDVFQTGLYQLQFRVFSRDKTRGRPSVRYDAIVVSHTSTIQFIERRNEFMMNAKELGNLQIPRDYMCDHDRACIRSKCHLKHLACDWTCKVEDSAGSLPLSFLSLSGLKAPQSTPLPTTTYATNTFYLQYKSERIPILNSVRFLLDWNAANEDQSYNEIFVEASLWFTSTEDTKLLQLNQVQHMKFRLTDTNLTLVNQYFPLTFDGIFSAVVDLHVSCCVSRTSIQHPAPFISIDGPLEDAKGWLASLISSSFQSSNTSFESEDEQITLSTQTQKSMEIILSISKMLYSWIQLETYLHGLHSTTSLEITIPKLEPAVVRDVDDILGENILPKDIVASERQEYITEAKWLRKRVHDTLVTFAARMRIDPESYSELIQKLCLIQIAFENKVQDLLNYIFNYTPLLLVSQISEYRKIAVIKEMSVHCNMLSSNLVESLAREIPLVEPDQVIFQLRAGSLAKVSPIFEHQFETDTDTNSASIKSSTISPDEIHYLSRAEKLCNLGDLQPNAHDKSNQTHVMIPTLLKAINRQDESTHLVVFVHGLRGSSSDLRPYYVRLSRYLYLLGVPQNRFHFLWSAENEDTTMGDIGVMAQTLAREVITYVTDSSLRFDKLSFVAHSIGGIIVRSAIGQPEMKPYLDRLCRFITFGTPHLGLVDHDNSALNSLIALYQTVSQSKCLDQLYLQDHLRTDYCFLRRLAKEDSISSFRYISLYGSLQDGYAPLSGALLLPTLEDTKEKKGASTMYDDVISRMISCDVKRYQIEFTGIADGSASVKNMFDPNAILGRYAHIDMIQNISCLDATIIHDRFLID